MTETPKKFDVAILGWWYGKNYGSILTYYGLNRTVENLGRSALMVHEPLGYNGYRIRWPDDMLSMEFARRMGYHYTEQTDFHALPELNELAHTFVVGSDQLWNPLIGRVNDDLFLDFVNPDNDRVAYGTSFGNRATSKFSADFVARQSVELQKFKAISVREDYAIQTARDIFGVKASLVVDPVFLLETDHYEQLADTATFTPPSGDYLAVFFLDATEAKRVAALAVADKLGYEKIVVIPNPDGGRKLATKLFEGEPRVQIVSEDAPENFLRAYRDASYVITDSFHGTGFAVIFGKPFSSIYNSRRGADRFKVLLTALGFGDSRRLQEDDTAEAIASNENVTLDINFDKARAHIESGRTASIAWLKDALDPEVKDNAAVRARQLYHLQNPVFVAENDAWKISARSSAARLRVAAGGVAKGNLAWTTLAQPLISGSFYKLTIDWTIRTKSPSINFHFRNADTGKYRGVAKLELGPSGSGTRRDTVIFQATEAGLSQFTIGTLHFTGRSAGADIRSISIEELPPARTPQAKNREAEPALISTYQFGGDQVDAAAVADAVTRAYEAPTINESINRRAHQITDDGLITALFGDSSDTLRPQLLVLVTCETTVTSDAQTDPALWVDGGVFSAAVMAGLQQADLGSHLVAAKLTAQHEAQLREVAGLSEGEVCIALIAVGSIPQSKKAGK